MVAEPGRKKQGQAGEKQNLPSSISLYGLPPEYAAQIWHGYSHHKWCIQETPHRHAQVLSCLGFSWFQMLSSGQPGLAIIVNKYIKLAKISLRLGQSRWYHSKVKNFRQVRLATLQKKYCKVKINLIYQIIFLLLHLACPLLRSFMVAFKSILEASPIWKFSKIKVHLLPGIVQLLFLPRTFSLSSFIHFFYNNPKCMTACHILFPPVFEMSDKDALLRYTLLYRVVALLCCASLSAYFLTTKNVFH